MIISGFAYLLLQFIQTLAAKQTVITSALYFDVTQRLSSTLTASTRQQPSTVRERYQWQWHQTWWPPDWASDLLQAEVAHRLYIRSGINDSTWFITKPLYLAGIFRSLCKRSESLCKNWYEWSSAYSSYRDCCVLISVRPLHLLHPYAFTLRPG